MGATIKHLIWCDFETTGRSWTQDWIIEIGIVITEASIPFKEVAEYSDVILPDGANWRDRMDSIVLDMHTENGLLDDIDTGGVPLRQVEQDLINLLSTIGRPHSFMFSGSAVSHFDRRFLIEQMPGLNRWVQPPSFDIGDVRRAFKYAGRSDLIAYGETFQGGEKPHRGLADVRDHLNEWRRYASLIESIERDET
jgi:oligoribonuclease